MSRASRRVPTSTGLRSRPVTSEPGRTGTRDVIGHPFRLVDVGVSWVVVPVCDQSRAVLDREDLLGRRFRTRTAALRALGEVLAGQSA